jgi:pimeloyl-ACP methyl ester carboxylesterase
MRTEKGFILTTSLVIVLAGCTATIDQSSFFPSAKQRPPVVTLSVPLGYTATSTLIDLPQLGLVRAVFLDNPSSNATIIYSAGNGGFVDSIGTSKAAANLAAVSGSDIILYDYPGRGGTTIPATVPAAIAVGPQLVKQFKTLGWLGKGPSFAYGFSFGGGMAAAMAREGGFSGLVIEGSASDYETIGRDFVPGIAKPFVKLKVSEDLKLFDYFGYAIAAKAPILLLSSIDDQAVRQARMRSFGNQLSAQGAKVTFQSTRGGHGAALDSVEGQAALKSFLAAR